MALENNTATKRFELKLNGESAFIEYNILENDIYDLIHTYVPEAYRGRSLGSKLANETFNYIISEKGRFKLTCDFLKACYEKNEDKYKQYLAL